MPGNFHFFSETPVFSAGRRVAEQLRRAGYPTFFVGGAVRDMLLGKTPSDIDIATAATPEQIHEIFPRTHDSGESFGVVTVHSDGFLFETATFRRECAYSDGRHPGETVYTDSPEEDVARRDFTINGMMLDPVSGEILDFVGGREDLRRGIIRTIGDGVRRFSEDALRILRAVRFSARYDFPLSPETEAAAKLRADAVPEARRESMALSAARGEEESGSFAIGAPEDREVTAEVSVSLDVPFRFHAAGYVPITDLTRGGTRIPGMYPDPLLPVTGPVTVPAGESRQFFITVRPDGETAPGEYEGKVTVKTADAEKSLPVTLRVYDVTLPLRGRLKTIVTVEPWRFSGFMPGSEIEAVVSDMCAESMRQRLTPDWRLPWEEIFSGGALNAERLDAEIARRLELGATTFRIENWFFVTDANSDTAGRQIALQEYLASRPEAAKLFYLYIFDEPASGQIEEIRRGITEIRSRIPAARIIGTTQWRQLTGCVDWWIPVSNHMNNPDWLAFMLRRKVMGDEAWFYTCNNTSMSCEADNWKIDAPGVTHRALGWQLWRFGCTGYLYWHINAVGSPENSVWQDPDPMKGSNGDGFMFYPPRPGDDPCRVYPALRLFLTREGLDDYELMALLEDRIQAIAASGDPDHLLTQELRTRACELLNVDDVVRRTDDYDSDPEVYENRHREVLEILEKLQ